MLSPRSAIARALRSMVSNRNDCSGVRFPRTVINNIPQRGENGWRRRVGNGANLGTLRCVRPLAPLPTAALHGGQRREALHLIALLCQAPLPTLQFAAQPLSQMLLQKRKHLAPAVECLLGPMRDPHRIEESVAAAII